MLLKIAILVSATTCSSYSSSFCSALASGRTDARSLVWILTLQWIGGGGGACVLYPCPVSYMKKAPLIFLRWRLTFGAIVLLHLICSNSHCCCCCNFLFLPLFARRVLHHHSPRRHRRWIYAPPQTHTLHPLSRSSSSPRFAFRCRYICRRIPQRIIPTFVLDVSSSACPLSPPSSSSYSHPIPHCRPSRDSFHRSFVHLCATTIRQEH